MKLEFSGSPIITASRDRVWERLMDLHFVAQSAPGVESVETIDPTHFRVISGFGGAAMKVRLTLDVELFDIVERQRAKMQVRGRAAGSEIDVLSTMQIEEVGAGSTQLDWHATSRVSGAVASLGARLMEGTTRRFTEQFWTDFARRVSQEDADARA